MCKAVKHIQVQCKKKIDILSRSIINDLLVNQLQVLILKKLRLSYLFWFTSILANLEKMTE